MQKGFLFSDETSYCSLQPLLLVLSLKDNVMSYSESSKWKLIHIFHCSVQLKYVVMAKDESLCQNHWFISGKEMKLHDEISSAVSSSCRYKFGVGHVLNLKNVKYYLQST